MPAEAEPSACNAPPAVAVSVPSACWREAAPRIRSPRVAVKVRSPFKAAVPSIRQAISALSVWSRPEPAREAICIEPAAVAVWVSAACTSPCPRR
ncbi:hypothetical protein WJ968_08155 [Achromobacter xylosoxidans]